MTPGAPTDGARSRFPGHRGSTEAGTTLKDSGQSTWASKDVFCVSPLIHEAGAGFAAPVSTCGCRGCPVARLAANASVAQEGPAGSRLRALPHGCDAQSHSIAFGDPDGLMTVTRPPYQPGLVNGGRASAVATDRDDLESEQRQDRSTGNDPRDVLPRVGVTSGWPLAYIHELATV